MTSTEKLNSLLQANNGFLKTSAAMSAGVSRTVLGDFVKKHGLERVARGLYISSNTWDDGMYVIQVRYPEAVFSHETALYLLALANREPVPFSVTLQAGANATGLTKQGIKVYKVKRELFGEGVISAQSPSGHTLRTYNAERTICDLFRSRRNVDVQDLQESVKEYLRQKDKNIPLLMRYAKAFSVERIVRGYLEVLL